MTVRIDGSTGISGLDGSSSIPAIQGANNSVGIFYPAANTVAISSSGSERLRIDANGNIGIGTSAPVTFLDLSGNRMAVGKDGSNFFWFKSRDVSSEPNSLAIGIAANTSHVTDICFRTTGNERMKIDATGNVGIGTSSPSQKLTITASNNSRIEQYADTNHRQYIYSNSVSGAQASGIGQGGYVSLSSSGVWSGTKSIANYPSYNIYFSNEYNQGIYFVRQLAGSTLTDGTITPLAYINTSGDMRIGIGPSYYGKLFARGGQMGNNNCNLGLATDGIANGERAGIAFMPTFSSVPADNGQRRTADILSGFTGAWGTEYLAFHVGSNGASNDTSNLTIERMRISGSGEVLIAGTGDQGAYNLQVNGTGVWGAGAYVNGSDARIKDDIASIGSCLDIVASLNPVTFKYKEDWSKDQNIQPGFIAQELKEALIDTNYVDGVVQQGPEYMSVAYQALIPILTKALQELKTETDSKLAALQAEFDAYKASH